ncbi:MvaI/BcnI family restriction endonuclease [Micrococcoides hystricis]|uniref:MvaI/BcnI family restriction endonuclease n=1 Tax=Micrococcoides hystricis TaxID=1572761 RepID=A0ABV6P8R6_9MICC
MATDIGDWVDSISLEGVLQLLSDSGCVTGIAKVLGRNNNSKQQLYLAPDLANLSMIPIGEIEEFETSSRKPAKNRIRYRTGIDWYWVSPSGMYHAPETKLIYYPQYPEVRLSGFLSGADVAPRHLMDYHGRGKEPGRVLFMGFTPEENVISVVVGADSPAAKEFMSKADEDPDKLLIPLNLTDSSAPTVVDTKRELLRILEQVFRKGPIASKQLTAAGVEVECRGPRCSGHTLEAEFGIVPNGVPGPDFLDWELKTLQGTTPSKAVTLFTPQPDTGMFLEEGLASFVLKHGILTPDGNRVNLTGRHFLGSKKVMPSGLNLQLIGYQQGSKLKDDVIERGGVLALVDAKTQEVAAGWSFEKLLKLWHDKHGKVAYVPNIRRTCPKSGQPSFAYGPYVDLAEGTSFKLLLRAISAGAVYYDPGNKLERTDSKARWVPKYRNQIRIGYGKLGLLYDQMERHVLV